MRTSTLVVLGLFLATAAPARTIYVASNGDAQGPAPSVETRYDDGSADHPFHELARAAATAETASRNGEPVLIELAGGHHWLTPQEYLDPTCGNCEDAATAVPATLGIRLAGRHVRLTGAPDHTSIVHTRSGYGILVQDCDECAVTGLLVTGGVRDPDGRATDAAIVVQRSSLLVRDNILRDNIGDAGTLAEVVVGVMGVTGREGSRLRLEGNRILRNSWDGVALYRDAEATIVDNVIDGIDLALGRDAGGGRGVGIGLTWNARATVRGNRITRYWKGIGVFVDAQAVVENNVVEGVATWGLSLWDAGRGRPHADFRGNVVDSTGACGASIVRERADGPPPGSLLENVFTRTGQNAKYDSGEPYCFQTAVAIESSPPTFRIEGNALFDNREARDEPGRGDRTIDDLGPRLDVVCSQLAQYRATRESGFFHRFCGATRPPSDPASPGSDTGSWNWGR